jgi:hypothetical protein
MAGKRSSTLLLLWLVVVVSSARDDTVTNGGYEQYSQKYVTDYASSAPQAASSGSWNAGKYEQYFQNYMTDHVGGKSGSPSIHSARQNGAYQKYSQKYMGQYAGSGGGGAIAAAGDYQKYYQEYMKPYAGASSGGAYQKYYQKYMAQYSGGDKGSSGSAAGEEPKPTYMAQDAGGGPQAASSDSGIEKVGYPGGGYYQTYMNHYAGGAPPTPPGPPEQQNVGYQQYISQSPGSGDYQKYYQEYMKKHTNASGCGDYLNYYQKYMAQYSGGAAGSSDSARGIAMAEAAECSTEKCLQVWRDNQEAVIKSTLPKAYQRCSSVSIEKEYEKNLARVKHSNATTAATTAPAIPTMDLATLIPPIAMAEAAACSTEECLKAWRVKQEIQIKSTIPKDVQHFALDSVEKEYERNLRFVRASPQEPAAIANALAASPLSMSSDTGHREGSAKTAVVERFRSRSSISIFGFCSLGLLLSITLYSRSRGCKTRRSQQRYVHLETDLGGSAEAWRNAAQKGERFVTSDDLENPYVNLVE